MISCPVFPGVNRRRSHVRPVQNLPLPTCVPHGGAALSPHGGKSESRRASRKHGARRQVGIPVFFQSARDDVGISGARSPRRRTKSGRISPAAVTGGPGTAAPRRGASDNFQKFFRRRLRFRATLPAVGPLSRYHGAARPGHLKKEDTS